ncbi:MAG: PIN domain-containing protein [Chitinivibrionales bacterium]|nr:PIN domain-containing protein [Chitinivibrionales bacterium]
MMKFMTDYIFIDTAAYVALLNRKDQYHLQAVTKSEELLKNKTRFITSTHVFAETVTRILRRVSHSKATEAGDIIRNDAATGIVTPDNEIIDQAWHTFLKYDDQQLSFVDCISFAMMTQLKISRVFTFDKHFRIMGFDII